MAPTIFNDCVVVLSGSFDGLTNGFLKTEITKNGGFIKTKVSDGVTHLVVSEKNLKNRVPAVQQAEGIPTVKIVGVEWVQSSLNKGKKLPERAYLLGPPATTSNNTTNPPQRKRTRGAKVNAESPEPPSKKRKADTKAGPKAGLKDEVKEAKKEVKEEAKEDVKEVKREIKEETKEEAKEAAKASARDLIIPVLDHWDIASNLGPGKGKVFVDDDEVIWDASLNQTNAGHNNNKFYRIQIIQTSDGLYNTLTQWGRVGEPGQSAVLGSGDVKSAISNFEKKFKDKSGHAWADRLVAPKKGKYTYIERTYEEKGASSSNGNGAVKGEHAASELERPVQRLMELIFNQDFFAATMADMSYDAKKLPLGKLAKRTIEQGYQALKDLAELLADNDLAKDKYNTSLPKALEDLSNTFYTVIPHSFGRNRPPVIKDDELLKREINLLDSLTEMSIADKIMNSSNDDADGLVPHPLDRQYNGLNLVEMTPLDPSGSEYQHLEEYLLKTHGSTHYIKFKVEDIFRIERDGENDRFRNSKFGQRKGDRRLLWHGSRSTNFGGILSQGLRIAPPEAPASGYMFGKGVYLADISSKSAHYTAYHQSNNTGLLLLCEAELGKPMLEMLQQNYHAGEEAAAKNCFSTWGQGRMVPSAWKSAGCIHTNLKQTMMPDTKMPPGNSNVHGGYLQYNEYICYDVTQICLRYLFRVNIVHSH